MVMIFSPNTSVQRNRGTAGGFASLEAVTARLEVGGNWREFRNIRK
jgi:hypothetical protein